MRERLLDFLRCPDCKQNLELVVFSIEGSEILEGILFCSGKHYFPVVRGIPRMLPSSLKDYWTEINTKIPQPVPEAIQELVNSQKLSAENHSYDTRTKANFSHEWDHHELGDRTWTMELDHRVECFFLNPINIPKEDLKGKVILDAGCGNGSQSTVYTEFGLEVLAVDLSTGLEKGYAFRHKRPHAQPDKVHYIQGDLQNPPLVANSVDIIHSAGVLHHTPNTEKTFRALRPLLKEGGTFYIWLYKYENVVTPVVNSIRAVTTKIPASIFSKITDAMAIPFIGFCWATNKLGIRAYETPNRREASLALLDIFGAPYAHYHSFEEVSEWYNSVGLTKIWACNDDRRGFGVCGKILAEERNQSDSAVN